METNNYIESWHNQLMTTYLQRKRNRRLDFFILVDDVHTGFMHNTARMAADIRRMGSKTREARKRMIAAEEINELPLEGVLMKNLKAHTMGEAALIQNTVENDHIEAATDSSDVLQSETPPEAGDRTNELSTSITSVRRQVLESHEDTYTEAISFIIERDFFPNLVKMKAQQNYFQAQQSGTLFDLQKASKALRDAQQPKKAEKKNQSINYYFEQESELEKRVNLDLSLDQFQTLYTSEDNASFAEILEKANQKAKEKNKWFFDKESNQLRITNGTQSVQLIEGPTGWKYKARNALMYYPEGKSESWIKEGDARGQPKAIDYKNTDITIPLTTQEDKPSSDIATQQGKVTPWTQLNQVDQHATSDASPALRGYQLVASTPALSPSRVGTPQMTWGSIEGTPMLVDGSATPGPKFSLPEISRREQLGMKLSEKASRAYRKKTSERVSKGTPRSGAGLMSPAAQHLLRKSQNSPHLQRTAFGDALRSAYGSSPLRTGSTVRRPGGTPTPVPLFRAGATPLAKNVKK
ncbi:DiGeorge syndrome critical region protein 14 [Rhizopus azygosporus]|uniref:DiGeorge syndrome critical region protein 14 n=1 Tax=Rhizopus azygosporus TaxID=86630 RepID=A0A367J601_RHIAZ|nr:DiGeorge syndrome critical region protein 14 [Rhizopus azygosporus]